MNNFKMDEKEILQRILRGLQCENKALKPKRSIRLVTNYHFISNMLLEQWLNISYISTRYNY